MSEAGRRAGVLVIDKPQGLTSFDVVRVVRRRYGGIKTGHTGTLDPLATGVLPICLGEATRIASLLLADDKVYSTTAQLGLVTDTLDITGKRMAEASIEGVGRADLEQLLERFVGEQDQVPPAFSALRKNGRRAHELARRGEPVELAPRRVVVHELRLLRWDPPRAELFVHCSKGTYVRALVDDLGQALGCGATVAELRRLRSGAFSLDQCVDLAQLEQPGGADVPLLTLDEALAHLAAVQVDRSSAWAIGQGQKGVRAEVPDAPLVRVRFEEELIALCEARAGGLIPRRVFDAGRSVVPPSASSAIGCIDRR